MEQAMKFKKIAHLKLLSFETQTLRLSESNYKDHTESGERTGLKTLVLQRQGLLNRFSLHDERLKG